ncbi:MAG: TatD family hydrolase [Desulfurococcales archaeon]|nr:TatD family hydrolase [Desulfurococcales archaeon]
MSIPVADAHTHTNPARGLGAAKIADRFHRSGGWFMAIVALPPWAYGLDFAGIESYREVLDILTRECMAAEEAGLKVSCLAGFHPADVDKLIDKYRMDPREVLELGLRVVEEYGNACRDGFLDGIGEVGRQHYKTTAERVIISEIILERALEIANDDDCIVHMHLENMGSVTIDLVDRYVERIGASKVKHRIVFHHMKPGHSVYASKLGYPATIPGTPELLKNVLGKTPPVFMLESDHIDDPMRPGAVVYPWVMADQVNRLRKRVGDDYLHRINIDNIVNVYRVSPP